MNIVLLLTIVKRGKKLHNTIPPWTSLLQSNATLTQISLHTFSK